MEIISNITTTTSRAYTSNVRHSTRDTYVLMAIVSVVLIAFAFVIVFMHRKCKNSLLNLKKWFVGKSPSIGRSTSQERLDNDQQTTSGKSPNLNLKVDHQSSSVSSNDVYTSPIYYFSKDEKMQKMKQNQSKERKVSLQTMNTMNTIQEDAGEEDSGISIISSSPLPNQYFNYNSNILGSGNYRDTPITVEHDGCLIRVLAPESFTCVTDTKHDKYLPDFLTGTKKKQNKCHCPGDLISSRRSSMTSFLQNEEYMRRNSSFSSLDGFTVELDECQCCPKRSYADISIGTSKCLSEGGSQTSLSNASGEYYLHEKQRSFDSLTSNEILMAIKGNCKRHSLKPRLEAKCSFESVSTLTVQDICDHDSCIEAMDRHLAMDDCSLADSCDFEDYINTNRNSRRSDRNLKTDNIKNIRSYDNFVFEYTDDFDDNRYNDRIPRVRCDTDTNSFESLEINTKRKLHRVSRSNTFPNRKKELCNSSS